MNDAFNLDYQDAPDVGAAPQEWLDALDRADADVAAGRVHEIDVDALWREIEAEAAALEAGQQQPHAPSAA